MKKFLSASLKQGAVLAALVTLTACASTRTQQAPGEYIDDVALTAQVKMALADSPQVKARKVDIETFRGVVQLNGFVSSANAKTQATRLAQGVTGVREVRNNLIVSAESDTVGEVVDDGIMTAKVKAALISDSTTKAHEINVTAERGVVHLGGFVDSAAQKARATEVAQSIDGVRSVRNELDVKTSR
jgi:hyperosmotically inducible protein